MQRFIGTIDFGGSAVFAYPKPAKPLPPTMSEKFTAEAMATAQREHERNAERARLLAMTQE